MPDLLITDDGRIIDDWDTGVEFLAKIVINNLFNKIMTALYSPEFGTDLKTLPQTNISDKEFEMKFSLMISEIEKKIKDEQEIYPGPIDEMLDKIIILRLYKNPFNRWQANLRIRAQSRKFYDLEKNLT
jgi:hypothetical protein